MARNCGLVCWWVPTAPIPGCGRSSAAASGARLWAVGRGGPCGSERPHQRTAWQCFTPEGPLALLPLADGRSSVVWSCVEAAARSLAARPTLNSARALTAATGGVLGNLRVTTPRLALPLAARHTHRYTGECFALIGDAAHQVHPLAGQGINLGLLDAAVLAETLATHLLGKRLADPGDALVLRRYERWRKGPTC